MEGRVPGDVVGARAGPPRTAVEGRADEVRCGVAAGLLAREQGEAEEGGGGGGGFRAYTMREEVISFWAGPSLSGAVGRGLWAEAP